MVPLAWGVPKVTRRWCWYPTVLSLVTVARGIPPTMTGGMGDDDWEEY